MKRINKKAFTLVELLAVIVILAILLAIAIPQVTQYISKSRKDSLVATAKDFVDSVRNDATSEIYELPIGTNDVTIVSLDLIKLDKGGKKSPFNGKWVTKNSYVAIINVGTDLDPEYDYYITLADTKRYTIPLMQGESITSNSIVRNNTQNTKVKVTSLCGSKDGQYMVLEKIYGLEKYQPFTGWNATVYSGNDC